MTYLLIVTLVNVEKIEFIQSTNSISKSSPHQDNFGEVEIRRISVKAQTSRLKLLTSLLITETTDISLVRIDTGTQNWPMRAEIY